MNKYLLYTISDFAESSLSCVNLLYDSLIQVNDNFDFYILTNNLNYNNIILPKKYNVVYINLSSNYIGWLKYINNLPNDYQYYFYFDSDILCYEKLDNLIDPKKDISIVKENISMSNDWFNYPFANKENKQKFNVIQGINAGLFAFKNKIFLNQVLEKSKLFDITNNDLKSQAMFEQSCFNYTCLNYILNNKYNDITSFVKLHATDEIDDESIYHFCDWQGAMDNKYLKMIRFHKNILK